MTVLYSRERVKEVLRPLSLATAHRIVLKPYLSDPLWQSVPRNPGSAMVGHMQCFMRLETLPRHSPKSWCAIAWCN